MYKKIKNKRKGKGEDKEEEEDKQGEEEEEEHEHQDSMVEEDHQNNHSHSPMNVGDDGGDEDDDDDDTCQDQDGKHTPSSDSYHFTTRNPRWSYLKLELISHHHHHQQQKQTTALDALTTRTYLTSALSQFLGLTGSSIPVDILKVSSLSSSPPLPLPEKENANENDNDNENENDNEEKGTKKRTPPPFVFIRVPREDASAVVAALSSWIGSDSASIGASSGTGGGGDVAWRICAKANFLGAVVAGSGAELFLS